LPLLVLRRHPERSEGSLYFVFAFAVACFIVAHPAESGSALCFRTKHFAPPKIQ
jgi:hypothetical protein